jgi:hypothetical protein
VNDVEKNSLARVQTSLLLSLQSKIEDQTLNSAWATRAIRYARLANAHTYYHDVPETEPLPREEEALVVLHTPRQDDHHRRTSEITGDARRL